MKLKHIILMALICFMLVAPALAVNMTFSEMGYAGPQTIQIFEINVTSGSAILVGTYNTTTNGVSVPTTDFSVVIKPESSDLLRNPVTLLDTLFAFVSAHPAEVIFLTFIVALLVFGRR